MKALGLPDEVRERLGQPFNIGSSEEIHLTGNGLAINKVIPEAHNMKVCIILNRNSGTSVGGHQHLEKILLQGFSDLNIIADLQAVNGDHIRSAALTALESNPDALIAAGGDGTISTIASVLTYSKVALGILPLGTLNHFAKDLKIPLDMWAAMKVIRDGHTKNIDLGIVNDRSFINNSSIGIYPWVIKTRDQRRSKFHSGKWIAMIVAWALCLKRFPLERVKIVFKDREVSLKTPFVFVGNNEYSKNLLRLGARERLDSGKIFLFTVRHEGRLGLLRLALHALTGRLNRERNFESINLTEVKIETARSITNVSLDGEVVSMTSPLLYSVQPLALKVLVPEDRPQQT